MQAKQFLVPLQRLPDRIAGIVLGNNLVIATSPKVDTSPPSFEGFAIDDATEKIYYAWKPPPGVPTYQNNLRPGSRDTRVRSP